MARKFARSALAAVALAIGANAAPAAEIGLAGPYLAARQAGFQSDYAAAARYYTLAMARDPGNVALLDNALLAFIGSGDLRGAARTALTFETRGGSNTVADLVLKADAVRQGDFSRTVEPIGESEGLTPLTLGLLRGWAQLGHGRMSAAEEAFDDVASVPDFISFARYHHALALASVGDFAGADAILSGERYGSLQLTPRGIQAFVQVLAQLDRRDDALELIRTTLDTRFDPALQQLQRDLEAGAAVPFDMVANPQEGSAEVFFNISAILNGRAAPEHVLTYARLASFVRPDHGRALILVAETLEDLGQYELAAEAFSAVPTDDPNYFLAEMGRSDALYADGREDAAVEVMRALAKSHGDKPIVHAALGDLLSRIGEDEDAIAAYDRSIEGRSEIDLSAWRVFYARGIVHERLDDFEEMERDFRAALDLYPNQPDVLNYLGYSLVEQRMKLDEALEMIQIAVRERPESGYITDSLGWVYYRLGRYEDAVAPMERAVALLPVDPIVNDHLGDVYWMVGRKREAEFQWKRALSFGPEPEEAERIRKKLDLGLYKVLEQEEAAQETLSAND